MLTTPSQEIAITPDHSIVWEKTELAEGTLFLPPQTTNGPRCEEVIHLLRNKSDGDFVGMGNSGGRVILPPSHLPQDVVVKEFASSASGGRIPDLRANVILAEGLKRVEQLRGWHIQGATILGAYVLGNQVNFNTRVSARWVMKRAEAIDAPIKTMLPNGYSIDYPKKTKLRPALPKQSKRLELYARAMAAAGAPSGSLVHYDDHAENLIIERAPERKWQRVTTPGLATKIDVMACSGFDF